MNEGQHHIAPTPPDRDVRYPVSRHRNVSFPTLQNFLLFCGIATGAALIELALVLVFIFYHLLIISQTIFLLTLALLSLSDLVGALFYVWRTAKPRAIRKYIQAVQDELAWYRNVYTPLSVLTDVYETSIVSQTDPAHIQLQNIQDLVRQQSRHLLFLGLPGAGKTMALRVYQHIALERYRELVHGDDKIPIFIPMRDYNVFLRKRNEEGTQQSTLLDYLYEGELRGIRHIRPYLKKWIRQDRILFLCDGLNEVDSSYLEFVCTELLQIMQEKRNGLVMTCRELDYREQSVFARLVGEDYALEALITPLGSKQIEGFVRKYITVGYVNEQGETWHCTPDDVIALIQQTRLRYECTNPLMLFTFMKTINGVGVEEGRRIDTRGRLLREFVSQLIQRELEKPNWKNPLFTADDLRLFLSQVACTARRMKYRNAMPLSGSRSSNGGLRRRRTYREMAVTLDGLLVDPSIAEALVVNEDADIASLLKSFPHPVLAKMLEFAESAALISISQDTLLSFRHELIAEYFVAECLCELHKHLPQSHLPFGRELITNVGDWNEPIRIWAGLLADPMMLARQLADLGLNNSNYGYNALTLSMMCIGVKWAPPQAQSTSKQSFPKSVIDLLTRFVTDKEKREKLAVTFDQCAQEGGVAVYRSLLHLLRYKDIDELLLLLNKMIVSELLFDYLRDAIDKDIYANEMKPLIRVLGRFGSYAIATAIKLSQPPSGPQQLPSEKQLRLRTAAIDILGRTREQGAVEPLVAYLGETGRVREMAVNALIRLGPELALEPVLKELAQQMSGPLVENVHWATLAIVEGFLNEQDAQPLGPMQHQRIIETLLPVLSSMYAQPFQQKTKSLLLREALPIRHRWKKVIELLIQQLPSTDTPMTLNVKEMLRQIGRDATPLLLIYLNQQRPPEILTVRIVEILGMVCDPQALPHLKSLVATSSQLIRDKVGEALLNYAPDSVPILIDLVLSSNESESTAITASHILEEIGETCIMEVIQVLPRVVLGRTQLLVQVLANVHDSRAVLPLIALLKVSQRDPSLATVVIQALSQFPDKRIVLPLLDVLAGSGSPLYEEASKALGLLGEIAVDDLIAVLDIEQETVTTRGVRSALLHMKPFPSEPLLNVFMLSSHTHAQQIMTVFRLRGEDAAPFLVSNLCHQNEHIHGYVRQTLDQMEEQHIIPSLLDALDHSTCRPIIAHYLQKYLQTTIPLLVGLLGDSRLGDAATTTLVEFGRIVIASLVPGLNDQRSNAQRHTQDVIVRLVRQHAEVLPEIIGLFRMISLPNEQHAYEALLNVLINHLAHVSMPTLLQELGSEYPQVKTGAIDALVHLVLKDDAQSDVVLEGLFAALEMEGQRMAAASALEQIVKKATAPALEQIGKRVVDRLSKFLHHEDPAVQATSQITMSNIGPFALDAVYSGINDPVMQAVLRDMKVPDIKDELVGRLASDNLQNVEKALTFLLVRIRDDALKPHTDQKMIPTLLEYVQTHDRESANLRIITFLLLLPRSAVLPYLVQVLSENPDPQQWLTPAFLLLGIEGGEAKAALLELIQNSKISHKLYVEVISILGMLDAHPIVIERAAAIGRSALNPFQTKNLAQPEQLEIAQRALGGLLASGKWNADELREREYRTRTPEGSVEHELYSVLLGKSYIPRITSLRNSLSEEQAARRSDYRNFQAQLSKKQAQIELLERQLGQKQEDVRVRDEELKKLEMEKQVLSRGLNEANRRNGELQGLKGKYEEQQRLLAAREELVKEMERTIQILQSGRRT